LAYDKCSTGQTKAAFHKTFQPSSPNKNNENLQHQSHLALSVHSNCKQTANHDRMRFCTWKTLVGCLYDVRGTTMAAVHRAAHFGRVNRTVRTTVARHGHSSQSATADKVTCSPVAPDDGWFEVGPPYDEMVKIRCSTSDCCTVFSPFRRKVAPPRTSRRQEQPAST